MVLTNSVIGSRISEISKIWQEAKSNDFIIKELGDDKFIVSLDKDPSLKKVYVDIKNNTGFVEAQNYVLDKPIPIDNNTDRPSFAISLNESDGSINTISLYPDTFVINENEVHVASTGKITNSESDSDSNSNMYEFNITDTNADVKSSSKINLLKIIKYIDKQDQVKQIAKITIESMSKLYPGLGAPVTTNGVVHLSCYSCRARHNCKTRCVKQCQCSGNCC
jgi:hypothetical protein